MDVKVGAYFYPITTQCPERARRARSFGAATIDEHELARSAQPLYPGHKQPRRYCLGDSAITHWDDSDPNMMARQVELAREFNVSFFIFNTYIGHRNGRPVQELAEPLEKAFLTCRAAQAMEFGVMLCFASPHAYLPLPNKGQDFEEPDRCYDLSPKSIEYVANHLVTRFFTEPNYLQITDRQFIAIYPDLGPGRRTESYYRKVIESLRENVVRYGIELYVVGVCKTVSNAREMSNAGADALTGYAFLPDFSQSREVPVQNYSSLLVKREEEWHAIATTGLPFVPPAVVDWDASPRGARGYTLEQVAGVYPFTPIVEGSTPHLFGMMLRKTMSFAAHYVPAEEQYGIVCAWNEIAEGCALLPQITNGREVDFGYLETVKHIVSGARSHAD